MKKLLVILMCLAVLVAIVSCSTKKTIDATFKLGDRGYSILMEAMMEDQKGSEDYAMMVLFSSVIEAMMKSVVKIDVTLNKAGDATINGKFDISFISDLTGTEDASDTQTRSGKYYINKDNHFIFTDEEAKIFDMGYLSEDMNTLYFVIPNDEYQVTLPLDRL